MDFADRVRAVAAEKKGATDDIASSVIDFVKKLSVEKIRLACDDESPILAATGKAREKCQSLAVIETTPRHISVSNGLTKTTVTRTSDYYGHCATTCRIGPRREQHRIRQLDIRWSDTLQRTSEELGSTKTSRAVYDRDDVQGIVSFAQIILYKSLAWEYRG